MPYVPTSWVSGSTPCDAPELNNLETQYTEATNSLEQDHLTPCVLTGLVATKDATTASQLDVATGVALVRQTDQALRRRALTTTNFSALGNPSATLFLDLNPDGTWSWGTAHSVVANHLTICTVTTDASANILTITDARTLNTTLFPSAAGAIGVPGRFSLGSVAGPLNAQAPQPSASFQGSVAGGVTSVAGALAHDPDAGLSFNGTSGMVTLPTAAIPNTANGVWSVECWFNASAYPASGFATLAAFGAVAAKSEALLYLNTSGQLTIDTDAGPNVVGSVVSKNVWHHAVATWTGPGGVLTLYLDGAQIGQVTGQPALTIGSTYFTLGARNAANYFTGSIDEVAVYGGALSATQVATHYQMGAMGPTSPTTTYASTILADLAKAYWRLDENPARGVVYAVASEHMAAVAADGSMNPTAIASVGNQASAGQFGVPVIVAQALDVNVTATGTQTIVGFNAPATGLYRASMYIYKGNTTTNQLVGQLQFTDPHNGVANNAYFQFASTYTTFEVLSGGTGDPSVLSGASIPTQPITFWAKTGTFIAVYYNDPSGTPADYVTALVERLA